MALRLQSFALRPQRLARRRRRPMALAKLIVSGMALAVALAAPAAAALEPAAPLASAASRVQAVTSTATFLGGRGADRAYGVAVDPAGNVYVAGETDSADFPQTGR